MSDMGIYKITNTVNGKVYIGQSTQLSRRLNNHLKDLKKNRHRNQHLQNSYNKYGDVFEIEIIEYCNDESELDDLERYYIAYYDSMNPQKGYNKEDGGNLNKHLSAETRKKMSEANKGENHPMYGKMHSAETRKKISEASKGKTFSAETRKKISEAKKGKTPSIETRKKISEAMKGENNPMYNKKHTEEAKKKISEAKKGENNPNFGKTLPKETKRKLSKAQNTTGFYCVIKVKASHYKQGFYWRYQYRIKSMRPSITATNLLKLKEKVEAQGLPWKIIDEEKVKESLELNNKYHKGEYK